MHLVLLAALLPAAGFAHAQVTFTTNRSLVFGRFVAGAGGTIIISPAGGRSSGGGVALVPSSGTSTPSSANFTYTDKSPGNASAGCTISLPPDGSVTLTNGSSTMTIGAFTSNPAPPAGTLSGGTLTISVGATLTVVANQAAGSYSGSLPMTIDCQ